MQLQYDTQDAVPEDLRESFVEFKDGDKTLFMHKDLAETKKEAYRFKGDLTHAQKLAQEKSERLQALELAEKQRQEDLEAKELESKKKNGQHEEILEYERAKWAKEKADILAEKEELKTERLKDKKQVEVARLSALGTEKTKVSLDMHINNDIQFDENDNFVIYIDGKATSLTISEYKAKLPELYPHLIGESHAKGGKTKGATAGSDFSAKKPSEMTSSERLEFKQRDPDGFKQYFNL